MPSARRTPARRRTSAGVRDSRRRAPAGRRRARRQKRARRDGLGGLWVLVGLAVAAMVFGAVQGLPMLTAPHAVVRSLAPVPVGSDASWPSCTHPHEPVAPAFAIVGVNNGTPGTKDPCLTTELAWAAGATDPAMRAAASYYVMAADPFRHYEAKYSKPRWPHSAMVAGYRVPVPAHYGGRCTGSHRSRSCAYLFGWTSAVRDAHLAGITHPAEHTWWVDVEAFRDWSGDITFNQAIVEGMVAYFTGHDHGALGGSAGLYSNILFWTGIVGPLRSGSPLAGLPDWVPIGPSTAADAAAATRTLEPFTPGSPVEIVQYVSGGVDLDVSTAEVAARDAAP